MHQAADQKLTKIKIDRALVAKRLELSSEHITAAGALSVELPVSFLHTSGAIAITLADGYFGQVKIVICEYDGGTATLTPANYGNGSTIVFDDTGDNWTGIFYAGYWWDITKTAT